ncbi:MAG: TIGR03067 domain-containing protein [Gemmataceae bacterium]
MATQSSFKQQCPSCEAMVPIRDPKLIGRKIDCPKCKYRFVVEEPVDEVEEAEEEAPAKKSKGGKTAITAKKPAGGKAGVRRPDDDEDVVDEDKPKKKQGGSGMLIVGIVLAAVALIALAIGGVFLLSSDSSDSPTPSRGTPANAAPTAANDVKPPEEVKKAPEEPKLPKPLEEDVTNLLPNDSQIVVNLPLDQLLGHARINEAMLRTSGSFNESAFQHIWGIAPTDIRRVVWASNAGKKTIFSVMRTSAVLNEKKIVTDLKLKEEAPIEGMKYYLVKRPLDALSTFLLKFDDHPARVAIHFMDPITVVCADVGPMTQFLQDKRQPKHLSSKQTEEDKPAQGGMQNMPGRSGGSGQPGAPGGKTPMTMGGPPRGFQPPAGMPQGMLPPGMSQGGTNGTTSDAAPVSSSYMTVDPHLKAVLDQVEKVDDKEGQNVLLSFAWLNSLKLVSSGGLTALILDQTPSALRDLFAMVEASDPKAFGVGVTAFSESKVSLNVGLAAKNVKTAQDLQTQGETALADLVLARGLDLVSKSAGGNVQTGTMSGRPGGMQGMMGGSSMPPPMMGGSGMGGKQSPNMPGMPNAPPGGPQMGGGFPMQQQPSGGMAGMRGSGMMPPGMQPSGNTQAEEKGKQGDYRFWTKDDVVALGINGNIPKAIYNEIGSKLEEVSIHSRGVMSMSDRQSHIHELAAAMQAYVDKEGHFPRGAMPRQINRHVLDWRPDQRLSWMTQLLPYLSNGEFKNIKIDYKMGWYDDPNNIKVGMTVIPQFVTPSSSDKPTYFVDYPNLPVKHEWAATNFVGIAGVGLDAAEYRGDDPAKAKLLGVFGYDRETQKTDIKDGLDQTIVLIQVPSSPKSPWIAGGGSTVRGVSEDLDCVKPFVCTEYHGKRGTFAIMANGKVRFIPATIDPKTFQALCTIAGGDKIKKLDDIAPEVPAPEEPAELPELKVQPDTASKQAKGDRSQDLQQIQGIWELVGGEVQGQTLPAELVKKMAGRLVINGDKYTEKTTVENEGGILKLDDTKTPKTVDCQITEGKDKGKTQLGIYTLSADELKLCFAEGGSKSRPTDFTTKGTTNQLYVFKRVKP